MVILKTKEEIATIREAGKILYGAMQLVEEKIQPGITTEEIDLIVENYIIEHDATPSFKGFQGFPRSICTSVGSQVVHGIPGDRVLKAGEIVSIDIGVNKNGYHSDSAKTFVLGDVDDEVRRLVDVTEKALYLGIAEATVGNNIGDISRAIQTHAESNGFAVVRQLVGHGLGRSLHEDPKVPNFVERDPGPELEKGMVLAIEPMINMEEVDVLTEQDGWTIVTKDGKPSAHFEHTIVILETGPKILTNGTSINWEDII
ncbi:MAG: type I methionyl aminopeptidase [Candidatus Marinimicrobia bacterium]|nr:type I methionyl aminopeptidase [Candidatus Neomarinimicrobiota bacterium]